MRSCSALRALRSTLGFTSAVPSARAPTRGWSVVVGCACATPAKASASAAAMVSSLICMETSLRPSQQPRDQRDQEEHHEHDEQDLGDFRRPGSDAGEAEDRRDDGDDEKRKRPAQHDGLLRLMVGEAGTGWSKACAHGARCDAQIAMRLYVSVARPM